MNFSYGLDNNEGFFKKLKNNSFSDLTISFSNENNFIFNEKFDELIDDPQKTQKLMDDYLEETFPVPEEIEIFGNVQQILASLSYVEKGKYINIFTDSNLIPTHNSVMVTHCQQSVVGKRKSYDNPEDNFVNTKKRK